MNRRRAAIWARVAFASALRRRRLRESTPPVAFSPPERGIALSTCAYRSGRAKEPASTAWCPDVDGALPDPERHVKPISSSTSKATATALAQVQALIAGTQTHFANTSFTLEG